MNSRIMRKIFQTGKYSCIITIPKEMIKQLGWQRGEMVEVDMNKKNKQLIIKKYKF